MTAPPGRPCIGVLALQGAFGLHLRVLGRLGVHAVEVRTLEDLGAVDALVIPGGESTTISMMLERDGLFEPIAGRLAAGMPAFGTCAGAILLGRRILDGRADQRCFGAIDLEVRRNAYGRQVDSFESTLEVAGDPVPLPATFIRAPVIESVGADVEVLAELDRHPVLCSTATVLVSTFHPELGADPRLHQRFVDMIR